ncbi:hypothetical protein AK830_g6996 [Neonectria ditissima]|uniref:F-box domain-containing protein n=1 Tax=Neonectria ditissima TaxID=78410 RepID=A0A0P7BB53_9HYPO|nr:hypothetical protein AK830_g6996 [Neonectria ditissima]
MELKKISAEILSLILGHLMVERSQEPAIIKDICIARLVCHQWNTLAIRHLFRSLTLAHTADGQFEAWNNLLANGCIRRAAQRVTIHSGPEDLLNGRDYDTWSEWSERAHYPAFVSAMNRIAELPNIRAIRLRFGDKCQGVECDTDWDDDVEVISTRLHTLKAVFSAIHQRANQNHTRNISIRSLTIVNLQNLPIPKFASSSLFKAVIKDINQLHLLVTEECTEGGPDHDVYCIERKQFEPYLQHELLPPLADQLTSLTLCFQECWGVTPGYFDGKGLIFPNLKNLALGNFIIGHHDQFDWILAQGSLKSLCLNRCFIVSHLSLEMRLLEEVRKHDWQCCAPGSYGHERDRDAVYTFSGTWAAVFDGILTRLPKLKLFSCSYDKIEAHFCRAETMITKLSAVRYTTYEWGLLPSPWIEAGRSGKNTGNVEFGYPVTGDKGDSYTGVVNRAEATMLSDSLALEALLEAVRERQ